MLKHMYPCVLAELLRHSCSSCTSPQMHAGCWVFSPTKKGLSEEVAGEGDHWHLWNFCSVCGSDGLLSRFLSRCSLCQLSDMKLQPSPASCLERSRFEPRPAASGGAGTLPAAQGDVQVFKQCLLVRGARACETRAPPASSSLPEGRVLACWRGRLPAWWQCYTAIQGTGFCDLEESSKISIKSVPNVCAFSLFFFFFPLCCDADGCRTV